MKRLLFTLALLISLSPALAAFVGLPPEVADQLPLIDRHPRASSVLLWAEESYALAENGKQAYEWHSFRYLPDEAARDRWGDPHVAYDADNETLEILASKAYTPDGRTVESTPENCYVPITPEALEHAPAMTRFRQMVVIHLGLENGCIVEFHYRLTKNASPLPWFEARVELREESPTGHRALKVAVPSGTPLLSDSRAGAPDPVTTGAMHVWTMGDIPGYDPADLAGQQDLLPHVVVSTAENWATLQTELTTRVNDSQSTELVPPKSLTDSLWMAEDNQARLEALKSWVRERFNHVEFHHAAFDVMLRPVSEILTSGYGNSLELAALVSKLLAQQGIENTVVLQHDGNPSVPSLSELKSILLDVKFDGRRALCDPLKPPAEFSELDLANSTLTYLNANADQASEYRPPVRSEFLLSIVFDDLDGDTLSGHGTLAASGPITPYGDLRASAPDEYVGGLVKLKEIACTDLTVQELTTDGAVVKFAFTAPALEKVDDYCVLPLSLMSFETPAGKSPLKLSERHFEQHLPTAATLRLDVRGELPEGWKISQSPRTETYGMAPEGENSGGLRAAVDMRQQDQRFEFSRSFEIVQSTISPADWPVYRKWMLASLPQPSNAIVFSIPKSADEK